MSLCPPPIPFVRTAACRCRAQRRCSRNQRVRRRGESPTSARDLPKPWLRSEALAYAGRKERRASRVAPRRGLRATRSATSGVAPHATTLELVRTAGHPTLGALSRRVLPAWTRRAIGGARRGLTVLQKALEGYRKVHEIAFAAAEARHLSWGRVRRLERATGPVVALSNTLAAKYDLVQRRRYEHACKAASREIPWGESNRDNPTSAEIRWGEPSNRTRHSHRDTPDGE